MERKPKISPGETIILDDEDIDQLNDLSLTMVLDEVTETLAQQSDKDKEEPAESDGEGSVLDEFDLDFLDKED